MIRMKPVVEEIHEVMDEHLTEEIDFKMHLKNLLPSAEPSEVQYLW